jgi:hypothetical protein
MAVGRRRCGESPPSVGRPREFALSCARHPLAPVISIEASLSMAWST